MNARAVLKMAKPFKCVIGAHHHLILDGDTDSAYQEARRKSDEAVAVCKYLIQMLEDRHAAVIFARAVGMDGYINMR
jgi:hypothetical protein